MVRQAAYHGVRGDMMNWHIMSSGEAAEALNTSIDKGLSAQEAQSRFEQYGPNELVGEQKRGIWQMLLDQFKDFMIIVLFAAALVSAVLGEWIDSLVIVTVVVLNAILGVVQESKAEQALAALKKMAAPNAKVIRDGKMQIMPAAQLVRGDVVVLESGDFVPADMRLIEAVNLKIEESSLTGESVPVEKDTKTLENDNISIGDRVNMAYMTSAVTYGRGKGIVVATGMDTEVGKVAQMIEQEDVQTPLQKRLEQLGKELAVAAVGICIAIFVIGIIYGRPWLDMFMTAVSLAVAAIPEGLPAIVTIVLAIGVQRMARRNAIIRRLPAVETLGAATVICSDKTGTLTQNRMTVQQIYIAGSIYDLNSDLPVDSKKVPLSLMLKVSLLCNDAIEDVDKGKAVGDPTETALLELGIRQGLHKAELEARMPRVDEVPFDSERKLMTTVHVCESRYFVLTKGALDELLKRCSMIHDDSGIRKITQTDIKTIAAINEKMAAQALRVLSMAYKEIGSLDYTDKQHELESELIFLGMVGMIDPPRPEAKDAVQVCRTAGIKPVMITGDHKLTAVAIAKELGILNHPDEAISGAELDEISDEEMQQKVQQYSVYARVSPEHKVKIVKAWQHRGDIVAMTGDGVNDAPALKRADIGAAMGKAGTDVAKGAADMVLTDDNFATVVAAVEEGRIIYSNIIKSIHFLLSCNIGEILALFIATILNWFQLLMPVHILWINLVTDSLPAIALSLERGERDIMQRPPRDPKENIMSWPMLINVLWQGAVISIAALVAFRIGSLVDHATGMTMAFLVLGLSQLMHSINMRSREKSILSMKWSDNPLMIPMLSLSALMQLIVVLFPFIRGIFKLTSLDAMHWFYTIVLALLPIAAVELWKLMIRFMNSTK